MWGEKIVKIRFQLFSDEKKQSKKMFFCPLSTKVGEGEGAKGLSGLSTKKKNLFFFKFAASLCGSILFLYKFESGIQIQMSHFPSDV